jgi:hypothetical protein
MLFLPIPKELGFTDIRAPTNAVDELDHGIPPRTLPYGLIPNISDCQRAR